MAGVHYDPTSAASEEVIAEFVSNDVAEDLHTIPGVNDAAVESLRTAECNSTVAVIGKFLSLHKSGMSPLEHCVGETLAAYT